jgi:hypothetical protein
MLTSHVNMSPIDRSPIDDSHIDACPIDTSPVDDSHVDACPIDTSHVDMNPVDDSHVDMSPIDACPVDTNPVDDGHDVSHVDQPTSMGATSLTASTATSTSSGVNANHVDGLLCEASPLLPPFCSSRNVINT